MATQSLLRVRNEQGFASAFARKPLIFRWCRSRNRTFPFVIENKGKCLVRKFFYLNVYPQSRAASLDHYNQGCASSSRGQPLCNSATTTCSYLRVQPTISANFVSSKDSLNGVAPQSIIIGMPISRSSVIRLGTPITFQKSQAPSTSPTGGHPGAVSWFECGMNTS